MRQFLSPPLPPPSMNIRTPTPPRAAGNHANAQARELSVTRDKLARITLRPSVTMSMLEKQKVGPRAEVKDEITAMEGLVIRSPPSEVEESSMENDELGFGCNPLPQCIPEPMQVSPSVPVPLMPRPEPIPVATAISTPVTVNSISNTTTIITSNSVQMPVPETKPASDAILQPISQTSFTSTPLPVSPPPASFLATPPTINPSSISPAVPTSASTPAFISAPVPVTVPVPTSVFQSPITEIPEKPEVQEKVRLVFS
ncbi:hypothetical protein EDC01DRAFT_659586 [Geopyxis carbonaria]|nr:hypothetical protein EDC01DRAFT_659586 [Geopyxis carbonaria]